MGFFDRQGKPISREVWRRLSQRPGYVSVLADVVETAQGIAELRTFWVGVGDHRHLLLFCTLVDQPDGGHRTWQWRAETDARRGHQHVNAWLSGREGIPDATHLIERAPPSRSPPERDP